jgi:hypothetical protein
MADQDEMLKVGGQITEEQKFSSDLDRQRPSLWDEEGIDAPLKMQRIKSLKKTTDEESSKFYTQ